MNARMKSLYEMLRKIETGGELLTVEQLEQRTVKETPYKGIRTYLSKYLGSVTRKHADGRLSVHGMLTMSEAEFAALLSQNKGNSAPVMKYDTRDEWANAMHELAAVGAKHGYRLNDDERVELLELISDSET